MCLTRESELNAVTVEIESMVIKSLDFRVRPGFMSIKLDWTLGKKKKLFVFFSVKKDSNVTEKLNEN